ncbi:MAG: aspartate dehydrogenase [Alphaproteobacteria bacterium]
MTTPLNVALIGLGAVAAPLVRRYLDGEFPANVRFVGALARRLRADAGLPVVTTADELLALEPDYIVEGAGHAAVRAHVETLLLAGKEVAVTSIGALIDDELRARLIRAAETGGGRLILPSAGIGALDMLAGMAEGGVTQATVTVRKPPEAWRDTPGEDLVDLESLTAPAVLFDGSVREGAPLYPGNVNISAAAAFAGAGLDRTRLVIVADPTVTNHVIELEAFGAAGRLAFTEDMLPSPDNPKTGVIVAMALAKTIRQRASSFVVGA